MRPGTDGDLGPRCGQAGAALPGPPPPGSHRGDQAPRRRAAPPVHETRRCWAPASARRPTVALLAPPATTPSRLRSEASFAARPAPSRRSGRTVRHRLNRGGPPGQPHCGASRWSACASTSAVAYAARLTARARDGDTPLPQTHRTRGLQADHRPARRRRTCAATAPNEGSPSTRQPEPSEPHPTGYPNSKEASSTTATSPNATSDTSHRPGVDKHRSIHRWSSPCVGARKAARAGER